MALAEIPLRTTIGYWVRHYREALPGSPSQEAFAHDLGISLGYLNSIELGKKTPSLTLLDHLADKLGVEPSDLLRKRDPQTTKYLFAEKKVA